MAIFVGTHHWWLHLLQESKNLAFQVNLAKSALVPWCPGAPWLEMCQVVAIRSGENAGEVHPQIRGVSTCPPCRYPKNTYRCWLLTNQFQLVHSFDSSPRWIPEYDRPDVWPCSRLVHATPRPRSILMPQNTTRSMAEVFDTQPHRQLLYRCSMLQNFWRSNDCPQLSHLSVLNHPACCVTSLGLRLPSWAGFLLAESTSFSFSCRECSSSGSTATIHSQWSSWTVQ